MSVQTDLEIRRDEIVIRLAGGGARLEPPVYCSSLSSAPCGLTVRFRLLLASWPRYYPRLRWIETTRTVGRTCGVGQGATGARLPWAVLFLCWALRECCRPLLTKQWLEIVELHQLSPTEGNHPPPLHTEAVDQPEVWGGGW